MACFALEQFSVNPRGPIQYLKIKGAFKNKFREPLEVFMVSLLQSTCLKIKETEQLGVLSPRF